MIQRDDILATVEKKYRKFFSANDFADLATEDRAFLKWIHKSGSVVHVSFGWPDAKLRTLRLKRNAMKSTGLRKFMCDWCKTIHDNSGVATFIAPSKVNRSTNFGVHLCRNLGCNEFAAELNRPRSVQMGETLGKEEKLLRLHHSVDDLYRKVAGLANLQ